MALSSPSSPRVDADERMICRFCPGGHEADVPLWTGDGPGQDARAAARAIRDIGPVLPGRLAARLRFYDVENEDSWMMTAGARSGP